MFSVLSITIHLSQTSTPLFMPSQHLTSMPQTYYFMASQSKEHSVLKLILESSPWRQWHFEEIIKETKVSRSVASKWLKIYCNQGLLKRIKEPGSFPYFTAGKNNPFYEAKKRIYALEHLYESGLIAYLAACDSVQTAVIFGSMHRGDWYKNSDVDLFILGDLGDFDKAGFERKLGRSIEIHQIESPKELRTITSTLLQNLINGYFVKGRVQDVVEVT
jgi:hypothetical protein